MKEREDQAWLGCIAKSLGIVQEIKIWPNSQIVYA